jgi:hypothetical protein
MSEHYKAVSGQKDWTNDRIKDPPEKLEEWKICEN